METFLKRNEKVMEFSDGLLISNLTELLISGAGISWSTRVAVWTLNTAQGGVGEWKQNMRGGLAVGSRLLYCTPRSQPRALSASVSVRARAWIRRCQDRSVGRCLGGRLISLFPLLGWVWVAASHPATGTCDVGWIWVDGRSGLSASQKRVDLSKRPGSRFGLLVRCAGT